MRLSGNEIIDILSEMFPDAHCELEHESPFQLAVAVVLSAQATDVSVNKVTKKLFADFPDAESMAKSSVKELEGYIRSIGLYRNKAKSIHGLATELVARFGGVMPTSMKELTSLPGVGRKSANVIRSVCFDIPSFAVDTHVERISKRLRLAIEEDTVLEVEKKLCRKIDRNRWNYAHHAMIFFGRYFCKSQNPSCATCPEKLRQQCRYYKAKNKLR